MVLPAARPDTGTMPDRARSLRNGSGASANRGQMGAIGSVLHLPLAFESGSWPKLDACMREIIDDLKNKREIDIPFLEDDWLRFLMPGTLDDALVTLPVPCCGRPRATPRPRRRT